jgi:hypothetical protein
MPSSSPQECDGRHHDAGRYGLLDGARRAGVRRQGGGLPPENALLGIDLDIKGHNALQSTFVFDA